MKTESVGADILLEAHQLVTGPRNNDYGNVVDDYSKVIQIFEGLTGIRMSMSDALLFMVSVKMARLRTNLEKNRLHHDTLADAIGYLGLLNQAYNDLPFLGPWRNDNGSPTLCLPTELHPPTQTCVRRETRGRR